MAYHKKVSNSKNFLTTHLSRNKIINNLCQKKGFKLGDVCSRQ